MYFPFWRITLQKLRILSEFARISANSQRHLLQYLGAWYEQKTVPSWFQPSSSCVRAVYGLNGKTRFILDLKEASLLFTHAVFSPLRPSTIRVLRPSSCSRGAGVLKIGFAFYRFSLSNLGFKYFLARYDSAKIFRLDFPSETLCFKYFNLFYSARFFKTPKSNLLTQITYFGN